MHGLFIVNIIFSFFSQLPTLNCNEIIINDKIITIQINITTSSTKQSACKTICFCTNEPCSKKNIKCDGISHRIFANITLELFNAKLISFRNNPTKTDTFFISDLSPPKITV